MTDNFFTSVKLFTDLLNLGMYATGTARQERKGFPKSIAGFTKRTMPARGTLVAKMHRSQDIAGICWMDNRPVWLLSMALGIQLTPLAQCLAG
jgi:hypothetical protein